jgi:hypothetical protein
MVELAPCTEPNPQTPPSSGNRHCKQFSGLLRKTISILVLDDLFWYGLPRLEGTSSNIQPKAGLKSRIDKETGDAKVDYCAVECSYSMDDPTRYAIGTRD